MRMKKTDNNIIDNNLLLINSEEKIKLQCKKNRGNSFEFETVIFTSIFEKRSNNSGRIT